MLQHVRRKYRTKFYRSETLSGACEISGLLIWLVSCLHKIDHTMSQGKKMNKYWIEQLREEFTKETGVDWRDQSFQDWLERKLLPRKAQTQTLH